MPFNGSGGFTSPGAPMFPAVTATTIVADYYNTVINDIYAGLGNAVTRDGQSPWTQNLPAGSKKVTGLGAGSINGDSVAFGQAAVTFGVVTATSMTTSAVGEGLRMNADAGYVSGFNAAGTTRTGYLQFNAGGAVTLAAEAAATTGMALTAATGTITSYVGGGAKSTAGALGFAVNQATGPALSTTAFWVHQATNKNVASYYNSGAAIPLAGFGAFDDAGTFIKMQLAGSGLGFSGNGGTTEHMTVLSTGFVGVGTTAPATNLDIRQDSGDGPIVLIQNRVVSGATHKFGALYFSPYRDVASPVYGAGMWAEGGAGAGYAADLVLATSTNLNSSVVPAEVLRLSSAGVATYRTNSANLEIGFRDLPTTVTYDANVRGKCLVVNAGLTINTLSNDAIHGVYNDSAVAITLTQGAGLTMRLGGTTTTGSRTLAPRGFASLFYRGASEVIVTGNVT